MIPVYIAGIATTVFGRHLDRPVHDLAREALDGAVTDARLPRRRHRRRVLFRHHAGLAAGTGRHSRPRRAEQDRHRLDPDLQRRERLRLGQRGVPPGGAEPAFGQCRRRAGDGRREDERAGQVPGARAVRGRAGTCSRSDEYQQALARIAEGLEMPAGARTDRPGSAVHGDRGRPVPPAHEALRHHAAPDRGRLGQEPPALGAQPALAVPPDLHRRRGPRGADRRLSADGADVCAAVGWRGGGHPLHRGRARAHRRRSEALHTGGGQRPAQLRAAPPRPAGTARRAAGRAAGLRAGRAGPAGHGRGRGPRRHRHGGDHAGREPGLRRRLARAGRPPSGASSRWADACRSIPRADSNRGGIRSARRAWPSCTS